MKIAWLAPYDINKLSPFIKNKRNKVTHACSWIVNLAEALVNNHDIKLHIITLSHLVSREEFFESNNISFHIIKTGIPFTRHGFPPYLPLDALTGFYFESKRIKNQIEHIEPDLVHAHGTEYAYGLSAINCGYPSMISIQGVINEYYKVDKSFRNLLVSHYELDQIKRCKYFACRTKFDAGFVKAHNPGAEIFTLQEAVNNVYFEEIWRPNDSKTILFVGAICKRKGVEVLLRSLPFVQKYIPDFSLCLIGNGSHDYLNYLKKLSVDLGVEGNVKFLGFKTAREIADWHIKSRMLVLPTYADNSPNSVFEAMVSGLPVISTSVGGLTSIIENGKTGLLTVPGDPKALSEKIIYLFENTQVCKRLSEQSRMIARPLHLPDNVAACAVEIYNRIIEYSKTKME